MKLCENHMKIQKLNSIDRSNDINQTRIENSHINESLHKKNICS